MDRFESFVADFIESVDEPMALVNFDGDVLAANHAWLHLFLVDKYGNDNHLNMFDLLKQLNRHQELSGLYTVLDEPIQAFTVKLPESISQSSSWSEMSITKFDHQYVLTRYVARETKVNTLLAIQSVLERMTDAFFSIQPDWTFNYVNQTAYELIEREEGSLIGQSIWRAFPEAVGTIFEEQYVAAMQDRGKHEFEAFYPPIEKWFQIKVFPNLSNGIWVFFTDITEKKLEEERLKLFAYFDDLTGLPNRRSMFSVMKGRLEKKVPAALLYIDLDRFKSINDMYGHEVGDQLIQKVSDRLSQYVGSKGFISRIGGDEFILFLEEEDAQNVKLFAQGLYHVLQQPLMLSDTLSMSLSASIGISLFPKDARSVNDLMNTADMAMYEAKRTNGLSFQFFDPSMRAKIDRRLIIEEALNQNISDHGLYFLFEPQIDVRTGQISAIEVLSRWKHPSLGEISPLEFMEIAEESGHLAKLMVHVFTEIFMCMARWRKWANFSTTVSMNISSYLLSQPSFMNDLLDMMNRFHIPPSQLELEIADDENFITSETAMSNMYSCQQAGISLVIDDFGHRFSYLSHLAFMPVKKLKLDRYFTSGIGQYPQQEALIRSIVFMANEMGYSISADGVDQEFQAQFLQDSGCYLMQGSFIHKPCSISEFEHRYLLRKDGLVDESSGGDA